MPDPTCHHIEPDRLDADTRSAPGMIDNLTLASSAAWHATTRTGQQCRTDLYGPSMSSLRACDRQAAYRAARSAPSDPEQAYTGEHRQAHLGTWLHEGYLPALSRILNGTLNIKTRLRGAGLSIPGTIDLYWERAGLVLDLKTVADDTALAALAGPSESWWYQVAGYAVGMAQHGRLVRWMAWTVLSRATGRTRQLVQPYNAQVAEIIEEYLTLLALYSSAPDAAPRTQPGPGRSLICDSCPWSTRCWSTP